ncbi:integumentary mucin A.1-like isoform X2 [Mercenaria mercenaria]|uniref:integumentary mucin A.1-like isoform X2 n=1 Tax=Mercenaria mercenaria TaxID=6596 RepID=UPI00234E38C8|nr:integumentary mucin A.1-like isoform X2 [Mercenaria mercenaria]
MKYLGLILILCIGVKVNANPLLLETIEDVGNSTNVTFVPPTTEGSTTISPTTGQTVSMETVSIPNTAPTIKPITTASHTTISTTPPPMTTESNSTMTTSNETMPTMETMTTAGTVTSGPSMTTNPSVYTTSQSVRTTKMKTTAAPQPTPKPKKHRFDGGSFAGGIALGLALAAIIIISYRCYIMRHRAKGYGDVN